MPRRRLRISKAEVRPSRCRARSFVLRRIGLSFQVKLGDLDLDDADTAARLLPAGRRSARRLVVPEHVLGGTWTRLPATTKRIAVAEAFLETIRAVPTRLRTSVRAVRRVSGGGWARQVGRAETSARKRLRRCASRARRACSATLYFAVDARSDRSRVDRARRWISSLPVLRAPLASAQAEVGRLAGPGLASWVESSEAVELVEQVRGLVTCGRAGSSDQRD